MKRSWEVTVEHDETTGNYYIQLPEEAMKAGGFEIGDSFYWSDNGDGSYTLIKEDLTTFIKKGIIKNEQD